MRFALVDQAKEGFPVDRLCPVLGVSQSDYFASKDRLVFAPCRTRFRLTRVSSANVTPHGRSTAGGNINNIGRDRGGLSEQAGVVEQVAGISRAPASVGVTLRVVRWSRRTPGRVSRRRTASLSVEALAPLFLAASRKPSAFATARKAARSPRSVSIARFSVQPVRTMRDYPALRQCLPKGEKRRTTCRRLSRQAVSGSATVM